MMHPQINISYWTDPDGTDFNHIEQFKKDLSKKYNTKIENRPTDALGGGLYEMAVEIISNVSFSDLIQDLAKDGAKAAIVYFWRPIFKLIKALFKENKNLNPNIEVAKFIFKDLNIFVYPLYSNSIEKSIDKIIEVLSKHFHNIKNKTKKSINSIHIPIFNKVDMHNICAYRVKLDIDENISSFSKDDYFKLWGIKQTKGNDLVYNLETKSILKVTFYTQDEYNSKLYKN